MKKNAGEFLSVPIQFRRARGTGLRVGHSASLNPSNLTRLTPPEEKQEPPASRGGSLRTDGGFGRNLPTKAPSMSSSAPATEVPPASGHRLFPSSRRVYIDGSRPDVRVPMREITLAPTRLPNGTEVPNEAVRVYDTAGEWGDADFHGDATRGLSPIRAAWIRERGDVEETAGRPIKPIDDGYLSEAHRTQAEAEGRRNPMKAFDRTGHAILRAKPDRKSVV